MKLLICYGTRPEYIKVKPLIKEFEGKLDFGTLHVGQHTDKDMIDNEKPDHFLLVPPSGSGNRLDVVFSFVVAGSHEIMKDYTHVLVQGDTATVAALAIAAFNNGKKVIHLEAGLRTNDLQNPFPEEGYRQMVSRLANLHLCPTLSAKKNLNREGIWDNIAVVGNTVLDNIKDVVPWYSNRVLITLHRRENHKQIAQYFDVLEFLALSNPDLELILPIHPNPNVKKYEYLLNKVSVVPPMSHLEFINTLKNCRFVISDSGGIQEEASFLGKRVIVCRKTTERQDGLNSFFNLCEYPDMLVSLFNEFKSDYRIDKPCPFGDGRAAEKILNEFKKRYSDMCIQ